MSKGLWEVSRMNSDTEFRGIKCIPCYISTENSLVV